MRSMRWMRLALLFPMLIVPTGLRAQDLDQTRKLYQDALAQLKAAQDRKNELDSENAKLNARLAEMEKQLDQLKQREATEAERTYGMRARSAAFEEFLKQNPDVRERWDFWLNFDARPGVNWQLGDASWPFAMNR